MRAVSLLLLLLLLTANGAPSATLSKETNLCLDCHRSVTPGIVADWIASRHAHTVPTEALKKSALERRISAETIPAELAGTVVGCAECHAMNSQARADAFEHNGVRIYTVVTPANCAVCHPVERSQYEQNIMSYAFVNLDANPLYRDLVNSINGIQTYADMKTSLSPPDDQTNAESCYYCHGTEVKVTGKIKRETDFGEMEFLILSGWPNQGVGRMNPDGTMGSCASCHARHAFSIETARKPYTCSECHKGPDVPAYKVYEVSKHGNIHSSMGEEWNFDNVPWVVGKDFTAPTCATCHVSLIATSEGEPITERTHRMNDRLPWRIFGLIYAHPHPKSPNTSIIKNKAGFPLPTELTGESATKFVIDDNEQAKRRETLQKVCLACHSTQWVEQQQARFENTLRTTNEMTRTATRILMTAWEKGAASGLPQGTSIFDEAIEKKWVEQWLFFANSTRFAAAMAGADYGAFANGRWYLSKNIQEMNDWLEVKLQSIQEEK